jgi:hypothetical protein
MGDQMRKEKMIKPRVTNFYLLGTFTQNARSIGYPLVFILTVFTSAGAPAGDGVPANPTSSHKVKIINHFQVDHNGPAEFIVQNRSQGSNAMTEIRALAGPNKIRRYGVNMVGICAVDLGTTGPNYDVPSDQSVNKNEAFLIGESTCDALHLKANFGDIKLTTANPLKTISVNKGTIILPQVEDSATCGPFMKATNTGARLCVDDNGYIWASTKKGVRRINASFFENLFD